jgi:hypothetical protein
LKAETFAVILAYIAAGDCDQRSSQQ